MHFRVQQHGLVVAKGESGTILRSRLTKQESKLKFRLGPRVGFGRIPKGTECQSFCSTVFNGLLGFAFANLLGSVEVTCSHNGRGPSIIDMIRHGHLVSRRQSRLAGPRRKAKKISLFGFGFSVLVLERYHGAPNYATREACIVMCLMAFSLTYPHVPTINYINYN